jgi:hypothetical protein
MADTDTDDSLYSQYGRALTEANQGAASLQQQALANMKSGSPGRMLLGAGQDVLAPVAGVMSPITAALDLAKQGLEYRFGAPVGNAFEVASNVIGGPEDAINAARMAARSTPTMAHVATAAPLAAAMIPARTAETAAQARQLNDIGLYSHAAEQANTLQPRGDAKQMISTLKNMPGVKPEELQNAGLLDAQGNVHPEWAGRGKITREDLAGHLQSSMPQVQETVLKSGNPYPYRDADEWQTAIQRAERAGNFNEAERLTNAWEAQEGYGGEGNAKYGQYTLPGGENYREVLLKYNSQPLSQNETAELADFRKRDPLGQIRKDEISRYQELIDKERDNPHLFKSNHWDDSNVLAHLRMADRNGPNGEKILHVEEMQSDWGQKGRDEGFKQDLSPEELHEYKNLKSKNTDLFLQLQNAAKNNNNELYDELIKQRQPVLDRIFELDDKHLENISKTPSAPYVTNTGSWTDLALKRALKEAAEGGYDKLVWTPGSEQAQRYDLSKQISRLVLENNPAGGHKLRAYSPSGDQVINQRIVDADKELPDLVGKEVAQKLLNQDLVNPKVFNENLTKDDISVVPKENRYQISAPWGWSTHVGMGVVNSPEAAAEYGANHFSNLAKKANSQMGTGHATEYKNATRTLVGQDLSVGGEGMKSYYDSIVPKQLQKITKQYDPSAKVGYTDVMLPPSGKAGTNNPPIQAPGIDITPQMRETIMRGQKAYKRGGRTLGNNAIDNAMRMALGGDAEIEMPHSLKELQDWKKNHPTSVSRSSMDDVFTGRVSGFEGAPPIAMPSNLDELLAYLRKHHASGGRAHFGFGGESESEGSRPESGGSGTVAAEKAAENQAEQNQQENSAAARQAAERFTVDNEPGLSAGQQIGQMGRGAGNRDALSAAIGDISGGVFGFAPRFDVGSARTRMQGEQPNPEDFQEYTQQRLDAMNNYKGSLLNAATYPSDAFGMAYPSLVGIQNTRAGAAGYLGSAMGESGKTLDPSAINASSIGMFQETGPRAAALKAALGIDPSLRGNALRDALAGTQMGQLGFGLNEVVSNPAYAPTARAMATGTNAANVADIALTNFERPTLENQILSGPVREAYAQNIMAGRPSGATTAIGGYGVKPDSYMAALTSGVRDARSQPRGGISDAGGYGVLAANAGNGSIMTPDLPDANAAPRTATTTAANEQIAPVTPVGSFEDPALIAAYNAQYGLSGPKSAYADLTLGQRAPVAASSNPVVNFLNGVNSLATDVLTPSYGINSPEYNKISQTPDRMLTDRTRGGEDPIVAAMAAARPQATQAPAPYIAQVGNYNAQLPSTTGLTAQQWAAANTGGDLSKVNGRIRYVNGAPMLEFYSA